MTKAVIGIIVFLLWLILIRILRKSGLKFWKFLVGALGLFLILFIFVQPLITSYLSQIVALIASFPGKALGFFEAYYRYGTIFVDSADGAMTLQIDLECSGIIEIMAFASLLSFFDVYSIYERVVVGVMGTIAIVISNALRICIICMMIHWKGSGIYYIAHTIVGRMVFYALSIILYFYVFTKPQIIKQKVGKFKYESDK